MKAEHAEHICDQVSVGRGGQITVAGKQTGQQVLLRGQTAYCWLSENACLTSEAGLTGKAEW